MKFLTAIMLFSMFLSQNEVVDIALSFDKVEKAESFRYGSTIYVAIVTEPIYLRSENIALCDKIESAIKEKSGANARVIIDVGAYIKIKQMKDKKGEDREKALNQIINIFGNRCFNEDSRYNQS